MTVRATPHGLDGESSRCPTPHGINEYIRLGFQRDRDETLEDSLRFGLDLCIGLAVSNSGRRQSR